MSGTVKAIETTYNGYRFRSRLEARYAVFFDALGEKYTYEEEGFELDSGKYLPDFFVPAWDAWVEIKPHEPEPAEFEKCRELATGIGKRVWLIYGVPWPMQHAVLDIRPGNADPFWGPLDWNDLGGYAYNQFAECRRCSGWCLVAEAPFNESWGEIGAHTCGDHDKHPWLGERIMAAYTAARGARFEHGESGAAPAQGDGFVPIYKRPEYRRYPRRTITAADLA